MHAHVVQGKSTKEAVADIRSTLTLDRIEAVVNIRSTVTFDRVLPIPFIIIPLGFLF